MKYLRSALIAHFTLGAFSSNELHKLARFSVRVPKISLANVQKRVGPSNFYGTVASWAGNGDCGGEASANETFHPTSNALGCLFLASGDPIESVNVNPGETFIYRLTLYNDTACTDMVFTDPFLQGQDCFPTAGFLATVMSVYLNIVA